MPKGVYERTPNMKTGKYPRTPEHIANQANSHRGHKLSTETVAHLVESLKEHRALNDVDCNCYVHSPNRRVSSLTWKLADALTKLGFRVQPEAKLGRRSIDVLLIDEWLAFEADGKYWHDINEAQFPGYHKTRDLELLKKWNLPTVRITEQEVLELEQA